MSSLKAMDMLKWERRSVVLTAFGLVGFGALIGAGSVFIIYFRHKLESRFQLQTDILQLKKEVDELKSTISKLSTDGQTIREKANVAVITPTTSTLTKLTKHTSDEEDYITCSESDDEEFGGAGDQDQLAQFFTKVDALLESESSEDQHQAFNMLRINKEKLHYSSDFWWRLARATHMEAAAALMAGDKELRKSHIETSVVYAEKALRLNEQSADAHKWYAITVGNNSEFLGINEKIQSGYKFKEHVDKAVALNPQDSTCYHLLGRFCLEVSQLSWIERRVAATLFSNPPNSTPKEALQYFMKCESLRPEFLENRFFIAKCHIAMGFNKDAAVWLQKCTEIKPKSASDKAAFQLVMQMFPKYRKYL